MNNVSVSADGGETWKTIKDKKGGFGCLVAFADDKTGCFGFGNKFEMTTDGGETWEGLPLPKDINRVAAISFRTHMDVYIIDDKGILYVTNDGCRTWSSKSLGLDNPGIMGFVSGGFVNEIPQTSVRFTDADHGVVVMGLSGKTSMIALHTADGGKTWKEESLPVTLFGAPYISHDGKFVTINKWGEGTTVLKYE